MMMSPRRRTGTTRETVLRVLGELKKEHIAQQKKDVRFITTTQIVGRR